MKSAVNANGRYVAPPPAHLISILPALPEPGDTSFYALRDVPHGKVEIVNYKISAGQEKQMHVYLPPDYATATERRYPVSS